MWPFGRKRAERRERDMAERAHLCENPPRAHSVREEYLHLVTRQCKCGGDYETLDHTLRYLKGQPRDVIEARCTRCRVFRCFVYDITFFFGKSDDEICRTTPSELLDVMDWAHHGYSCLHQGSAATGEGSAVRAERQDRLLQDAIWAFEEMLKFYPSNGNYPFPIGFFNHKAVHHSQLRLRYPRHLISDAVGAARARLRKIEQD